MEEYPTLSELFSHTTQEKRAASYKAHGEGHLSQSKRREERLRAQKQNRYNYQQLLRATLDEAVCEEEEIPEERGKKRKATEITQVTRKDKIDMREQKEYKDKLMLPEAFEEVPEDLAESWVCIPVPSGQRVLVVSHKDTTVIRLRNGALLRSFQSLLPGGGSKMATARSHCILDCILHEPTATLYVLDILVWKGDSYYDCETEFRGFWTYNKLQEEDGLLEDHPYKFAPLQRFTCDEQLQHAYGNNFPFGTPTSYFLYHKEAHYWEGKSPLMGQVQDLAELDIA
eukprot:TRINITY_DN6251_c0_g1_i1.p1 TRINITY_DN6251_c0_g1~~TRINITY_DN6251_c0_g1_i1.p1  ORF type:complete len:285 (-),score=65.80 TRINITY_DN6251_c0_g1_i1:6-860(-)